MEPSQAPDVQGNGVDSEETTPEVEATPAQGVDEAEAQATETESGSDGENE